MSRRKDAAREELRRRKLRRKCREDLLTFIVETHPNFEVNWHHELMCKWLMMLESPDFEDVQNVAVFAPPRHGKTEIVSRRFPAWCFGRNPGWEMICAQKNDKLAQDTGANVRDIVSSPEYREIFPHIGLKTDAKAAGRWVVQDTVAGGKEGVYYAAGIGGTIIGRGANLLNIDDPLDGEGASSPRQRQIAAQFYFGDAIQRLMYPRLQLFTTTRRHEDDLAGRVVPPEQDWVPVEGEEFVFRAEMPTEGYADPVVWWIVRLPAIINEGTGEERALWPGVDGKRFPLPFLKAQRAKIFNDGQAREWFAQYQQIITPEEGNFCKKAWYEERWTPETLPEDLWIYATSDMAVTEERAGADPDYTEHCVYGLEGLQIEYDSNGEMKATADGLYLLDWWAGKTTPDVWIDELVKLFETWNPACWFGTKGVIRNSIEGYLLRELRNRRCWTRVEWLGDVKDKAAKGRPLQAMSSAGRIFFPKTAWAERVINNICTFPNARHDDAFDAASNAVRSLGEIPDAFIGAPVKLRTASYDNYEVWHEEPAQNWKAL